MLIQICLFAMNLCNQCLKIFLPVCNSNISILGRFGREMSYGKNKQTYNNKQWEKYLGTKSISSNLLHNVIWSYLFHLRESLLEQPP